jgi:hypothetical protein
VLNEDLQTEEMKKIAWEILLSVISDKNGLAGRDSIATEDSVVHRRCVSLTPCGRRLQWRCVWAWGGRTSLIEVQKMSQTAYPNATHITGILHSNLHTQKKLSLYDIHGIKGSKGCGRACNFPEIQGGRHGPNQSDFSRITASYSVSISPAELGMEYDVVRPFFEAIVEEGIGTIVDFQNYKNERLYIGDIADKNPNCLRIFGNKTPLSSGIETNGVPMRYHMDVEICVERKWHGVKYIRVRDLEGNEAFSTEQMFFLMRDINSIAGSRKIVFHCNGGIGRSPMMCVAYTMWMAFAIAVKGGVWLVFCEKQQLQWSVGKKLNLAAVLRYILCFGTYARSTFIHAEKQFIALVDFGKYLVKTADSQLEKSTAFAN